MPKIFFASDLHGSEVCWKKFLNSARFYDAEILICGGDMTGKAILPVVSENGHYTVALGGAQQSVPVEQVADVEANIRRKGYYPLRMSVERLHELDQNPEMRAECFQEVMLEGVERWMGMAAEKLRGTGVRCFVCPGNDDEMQVDDVVRRAELVELGEGRMVDISGFSMISTGWSNPTPWNTHREDSEEKLGERIEAMVAQIPDPRRAIFNLHCPPYKSGLDEAPAIDADLRLLHGGRALRPVGSTAVREAIEKHQPLLSLHGHIHESKGAVKIGKTLSINPGSAYEEGMLMGAIIQLDAVKGIKSYQLVNAWSTFDAFIYSFMSVKLVTLALYYGTASGWFVPGGQLLTAVLLTGVFVSFVVVVYAGLVTAMPRTGGDYAWQSRVLGGGIAFVLAVTGWWFILWYWTPIYGSILVAEFINPLAATLGWSGVTSFFTTEMGVFVACLLTLAYVSVVVTLGMETYARIQKISFWVGLAGIAVVCVILAVASASDFQNAFNREAHSLFGASGNAYQATIDAGQKAGAAPQGFLDFSLQPTLLFIPLLLFALLWPNWDARL